MATRGIVRGDLPVCVRGSSQVRVKADHRRSVGGIGVVTDEARLDPNRSCFAMGQSAGGIRDVRPVAEIVASLLEEAEAAIAKTQGYVRVEA